MSAACASPPFVQYPLDTTYIMQTHDWPSPAASTSSKPTPVHECNTYWRTNDWNTLGKYPFATKIHLEENYQSTTTTVVPAPSTSTYGLYAAQAHQAIVESNASEHHHTSPLHDHGHSHSHSHDAGSYFDLGLDRTRSLSPPYVPDVETAATSPQSALYDPLHAHGSPSIGYMTSPGMHPLVPYQPPQQALDTLIQPFDMISSPAPLVSQTGAEPLVQVQEQPVDQQQLPSTREPSASGDEGLELVKLPSGQWQCPHCFKQFRRRDRGQAHVNVHINTRPYRCEGSCGNLGCDRSYFSQESLQSHTQHAMIICETCGKELRKKNISRHRKRYCTAKSTP